MIISNIIHTRLPSLPPIVNTIIRHESVCELSEKALRYLSETYRLLYLFLNKRFSYGLFNNPSRVSVVYHDDDTYPKIYQSQYYDYMDEEESLYINIDIFSHEDAYRKIPQIHTLVKLIQFMQITNSLQETFNIVEKFCKEQGFNISKNEIIP